MDGNGRWAAQRGKPRFHGHREGAKKIETVCDTAREIGLECITLYCFSVQNWKRPSMEVEFLMQLFTRYLVAVREYLQKHNMSLLHFGRRDGLPSEMLTELDKTIEGTAENTGLALALALNYGGREEILDACKSIVREGIAPEDITEQTISSRIYSSGLPDPELIIRTSGEFRTSNFLLWQASYAEYYVTDTLWPDFSREEFIEAVCSFAGRERRIGDVRPAGK
jgi:undecaprenyl diphosphate synthase